MTIAARAKLILIIVAVVAASLEADSIYIEGYTTRESYVAGDLIEFHVSTNSSTYQIEVFRDGLVPQMIATSASLNGGVRAMPPSAWLGANWPVSYVWEVPSAWVTGSYYARFVTPSGVSRRHPFTVRQSIPGSLSRMAFCMDYNTRNAYNFWGGRSLYVGTPWATKVSFQRPYGVEDGLGKGAYLPVQCHGRIEAEGYPLEYITEWDVEKFPALLSAYDVVIFSAHLEYNSTPFIDTLWAHHVRGGHMAFFSANDLWWQVRFEDDGATMVGYKGIAIPYDPLYGSNNQLVTTHWNEMLLNRPGEALQGVTFQANSGAYFQGGNYIVQNASHWIFAGTGVQDGQTVGQLLASYETDAIGRASPPVVDVLLAARLSQPATNQTPPQPFDAVTAVYYEDSPAYGFPNGRGGQVFSSGTQIFCTSFRDSDPSHVVTRRMLRNLLDHMLASPPPSTLLVAPRPAPMPITAAPTR